MPFIRVRQRGQITLPKPILKEIGLLEDTPLRVETKQGKIILEPISNSPYPTREYSKAQIDQFIKDDQLSPALAKKAKQLLS